MGMAWDRGNKELGIAIAASQSNLASARFSRLLDCGEIFRGDIYKVSVLV